MTTQHSTHNTIPNNIPQQMAGVYLMGHGGFDKLEYREDIPTAKAGIGEVLIKVAACGINNTDVNTRIGWYSKSVTGDTNANATEGYSQLNEDDGSWSGIPLQFPRIQGADCTGVIVAVGEGVDRGRIGERVLARSVTRVGSDGQTTHCATLGSESNGAFAQYTKMLSHNALKINSNWSDIELASIPCAYSTAEGLLHRSQVNENDTVLITGASGGVGSAALQLSKRRGAKVIAIASEEKLEQIKQIGADEVIARNADVLQVLGNNSVTVVIDLVAGSQWTKLLEVLKPGGRYATSGAIAGPIVELDVRTLYLKDLTFYGCTYQPDIIFENLIGYIEKNQIKPLVAKSYPLQEIVSAQKDFLAKKFIGKLVLIPPQ